VSAQPVVRFVGQLPGHPDCGVSAFAMCFGLTYARALVAIIGAAPRVLEEGVTTRQFQKAAKRLGGVLRVVTRGVDVEDEETEGILCVIFVSGGERHAVYLKRGLIFDGRTDAVWDADVYLRIHNADIESLLVRA